MMLTIVPIDNFVNIDGEKRTFDLSSFNIDSNYHAIHWDGTNGEIETKTGANVIIPRDLEISVFQPVIDAHAAILAQEVIDAAAALVEFNLPANVTIREMRPVNDLTTLLFLHHDFRIARNYAQVQRSLTPSDDATKMNEIYDWGEAMRSTLNSADTPTEKLAAMETHQTNTPA